MKFVKSNFLNLNFEDFVRIGLLILCLVSIIMTIGILWIENGVQKICFIRFLEIVLSYFLFKFYDSEPDKSFFLMFPRHPHIEID